MSEITRKALEAMGFESGGQLNYYSMALTNGWVSVSYNIAWDKEPKVSCSMFKTGKYLTHIRTLPQLRQLIRSLFGDDALPRRELSSITDEECRQLGEIAFGYNFSRLDLERGKNVIVFMDVDVAYGGVSERGDFEIYRTGAISSRHGGISSAVALKMQSYLINVCDFYLPYLHDDMGGEQ